MRYLNATGVFLWFLLCLYGPHAVAQSLDGQKLVKYEHNSWKLATATASFEGKVPAGSVRGAAVELDKSDQMRIEIQYKGLDDAIMKAEVLDRKRRPVEAIELQKMRLNGLPAVLEFRFLSESESARVESGYLKLTFSKDESGKKGLTTGFRLPKVWRSASEPLVSTNQKTATVDLQAVGAAGRLQEGRMAFPAPHRRQNISSVGITGPNKIRIRPMGDGVASENEEEEEEPDTRPLGPGAIAISIWESLQADVDFQAPYEVINIRPEIFADRNPHSGVYYYLPAAYHIRWTPDEQYDFSIIHSTATDTDVGKARMRVTLTPGISRDEVKIVQQLLESYARNLAEDRVQLRPLPLAKPPSISLASELGRQFEIPAENVSTSQSSSFFEPIRLAWETDIHTKEEMKTALMARVGISGNMLLVPAGDSLASQQIPVFLNLADERTIDKMVLNPQNWRNRAWRNPTSYPLELAYLHAFMVKPEEEGSTPLIYSWKIRGERVEPGQSVSISHNGVPSWVDRHASRLWISYRVASCGPCDERVMRDIEKGNVSSSIEEVSFETFNVLEEIGAQHLNIKVRSRYAAPGGGRVSEIEPVRLAGDFEPQSTGPLHLPANRPGGQPLFEYYLTLVMPDGTKHVALDWVSSKELDVLLGPKQVKRALGPLRIFDQLP